jgi:hypothetical protein
MSKKNRRDRYAEIDERYATRHCTYSFWVPYNFRLLCTLLQLKPEQVLSDFMNAIAFSPGTKGTERMQAAAAYFLKCGYGQDLYSREQVQQMFRELEAQHTLWPELLSMTSDQHRRHIAWRNMYVQYWFKKWLHGTGSGHKPKVSMPCKSSC